MNELKSDPSGFLEGRPEAKAIKIEDLLKHVQQGRVRVPPFQRPLNWGKKDALYLMDSIFRGYPIGTLLFWETEGESFQMTLGNVRVTGGQRPDAWWIVDGQQRVASLVRVLLARPEDLDEFALVFDLDNAVFQPVAKATSKDSSRWLPMSEVLDSEKLMQWVFKNAQGDHGPRRERAFQLGKRIREYEIPTYVVRSNDETILREIFGRVNSTGKPLESHQVFDALNGAKSAGVPLSISQISSSLINLDFGRVDEKILYRLLRVLMGEDVTERIGPLRLEDDAAHVAYADAAKAAARVIQFLKTEAGIPNYELIPYKQPFVTLGKFFFLHPSPAARSKELLVRWLWRGALNGLHRGDTVSTRGILGAIDPKDEHGSVQGMLSSAKVSSSDEVPVYESGAPFNFRRAASKLQVLALANLRPRDLSTGEILDVGKLFVGLADDELPLPQLLTQNGPMHGLWASSANRLLHPPRHGLRKELIAVNDPALLASHGISEQAHIALCRGRHLDFLTARAQFLQAHYQSFFYRNARWDESDRPPLRSLVIPEND